MSLRQSLIDALHEKDRVTPHQLSKEEYADAVTDWLATKLPADRAVRDVVHALVDGNERPDA